MVKVEFTESKIREEFRNAKSDETRKMLKELFPAVFNEQNKKKPTLDDYTSITGYEDACEALGESPILSDDYVRGLDGNEGDMDFYIYGCERYNTEWETLIYQLPDHIIALMKLETISRALWGRHWQPRPNSREDETVYWPWFHLLTCEDFDGLNEANQKRIISAASGDGEYIGFGSTYLHHREVFTDAYSSYRLCQETPEKAKYFGGRAFVKLWAKYLQFNFETGNFVID
ncbi:MAG: hypothetical protein ACI4C3_00355 [Bacteroides sp.]